MLVLKLVAQECGVNKSETTLLNFNNSTNKKSFSTKDCKIDFWA